MAGLDRSAQRITCRTDGIILRLSVDRRQQASSLLGFFSGGRGLRKASDLAKPLVLV